MLQYMKRLSIPLKVNVTFSILIFITLLASIITYFAMSTAQEAQQRATEVQEIRAKYAEMVGAIDNQRQSILYLLVASDRAAVASYEDEQKHFERTAKELIALSRNFSGILNKAKQVIEASDEWREQFAAQQIKLTANYLTVNEARAIEATGNPGEQFNHVLDLRKEFEVAVEKVAQEATSVSEQAIQSVKTTSIISNILIISVAVGAAFLFLSLIVSPIKRMTSTMLNLADGDNTVNIPGLSFEDEIGDMANAVDTFKKNAIEREELEKEAETARLEQERMEREQTERDKAEQEAELKRQEEAMRAREKKAAAVENLITTFDAGVEEALSTVSLALSDLSQTAQVLVDTASKTSNMSSAVSAAAEESSANVETVAAATEELGNSISEIVRQMELSADQSQNTAEVASSSEKLMQALTDSSTEIGKIVELINDIAEQTNLLALNATIEAARAGDAGRGFAVVASEVKSLATQTAKATDQIAQQIGAVQSQTGEVSTAMLTIHDNVIKITDMASGVASAVEEQRAATDEIARNVQEASTGTRDVTQNVMGVAEGAQRTQEASDTVSTNSKSIEQAIGKMKAVTNTFLEAVRSELTTQ